MPRLPKTQTGSCDDTAFVALQRRAEPMIASGRVAQPAEASSVLRRRVALCYLGAVAAGDLAWELLQLPLYTLWRTETAGRIAFAALHCWVGDLLIAAVCLLAAILLAGRGWPGRHYVRVAALSTILGIAYTVFSEWMNVELRGSWAYAPIMPVLPLLGTGLSPLLQWVVVPPSAFAWAHPAHALQDAAA